MAGNIIGCNVYSDTFGEDSAGVAGMEGNLIRDVFFIRSGEDSAGMAGMEGGGGSGGGFGGDFEFGVDPAGEIICCVAMAKQLVHSKCFIH